MVDGGGLADARDLESLRRAYAGRVLEDPNAHAWQLGSLRREFAQARDDLRRPSRAPPADLSTAEGWFRAFVLGNASRAELADALGSLPEEDARALRGLRRLLPHHAAWMRARLDRSIPHDLLREIAKGMRPSPPPPPPPDTSHEVRLAALRARRRHPVLPVLAPRFYAGLLVPDIRKASPIPGVSAATRRRSRRAATARGTKSRSSTGVSTIFWGILLMSSLRACYRCSSGNQERAGSQTDVRKLLDDLENTRRQIDRPNSEEFPRPPRPHAGPSEVPGAGGR